MKAIDFLMLYQWDGHNLIHDSWVIAAYCRKPAGTPSSNLKSPLPTPGNSRVIVNL